MAKVEDNLFGKFLRDRRAKLDPGSFGFGVTNRRTRGLRREEVAQRANLSVTWYTWLEQGRGGEPSADVLDRISRALILSPLEREHLFLLGQGRPPEVRVDGQDDVTPRMQRMLDALEFVPAFIKTPLWDVLAWNRAAATVLSDFGAMPRERRNILKLVFLDPEVRAANTTWEGSASLAISTLRREAARTGMMNQANLLAEEMCDLSPEFAALWHDDTAVSVFGDNVKLLNHPVAGMLSLEYGSFTIDSNPHLGMVVYSPADAEGARKIRSLIGH